MPIYRRPEEKASETVTIRLTIHERRMLDHLASVDEKTLTDFLRGLIFKRADELGITEPPPPKPKRRPGRPKMKKRPSEAPVPSPLPSEIVAAKMASVPTTASPSVLPKPPPAAPPSLEIPIPSAETIALVVPEPTPMESEPKPTEMTVLDLIDRFKQTFQHRADGTKKELNDTMAFFFTAKDGSPIVPPNLPISEISSDKLKAVRDAVKTADLRLAKKNLHLTYFRMMLHFAVKEPDIDLRVNPTRDLEPLTITESNEGWRFFSGPSK